MHALISDARPIFIIGSYRAGTSVLGWCLGQHSNILHLEETHWLARLTVYLHRLYEVGTVNGEHSHLGSLGWSIDAFFEHFGKSLDLFIVNTREARLSQAERSAAARGFDSGPNYKLVRNEGDPKRRWVDATPENTLYVYGLKKLFPHAKFIHILRNPCEVARSLMNFSKAGGTDYSEKAAYQAWLRLVQAAVEAEQALGSSEVLRVNYDDLIAERKKTLETCLNFIGEAFEDHCLLPLNERINSSSPSTGEARAGTLRLPSWTRRANRAALNYFAHIVASYDPARSPDPSIYACMQTKYNLHVAKALLSLKSLPRLVFKALFASDR